MTGHLWWYDTMMHMWIFVLMAMLKQAVIPTIAMLLSTIQRWYVLMSRLLMTHGNSQGTNAGPVNSNITAC